MKHLSITLLALFLGHATVWAQTSFPMITHAMPVAVQRGQTTVITVNGTQNFAETYEAIFEGDGISVEVVPEKKPAKVSRLVKLKISVAADAPMGVREFRTISKLGVSSIGQLVIVNDPVISEISSNDTIAQAQEFKLPQVLTGRLEKKEDIDYYKFTAKAGESLSFEMYCARLQDKIHDLQKHAKPMLVLYDEDGRELASNDHFFFADPLLTFKVKKDGTYYLQVRESTYDGDPRWVYAIHATNQPYASHIFPFAGNPGAKVSVEPIGSAFGSASKQEVQFPKNSGVQQLSLHVNGVTTNPVTILVSDLPQTLEKEGNDEPATATPVTIPCGINGRIGETRDLDHFRFSAKKGKAIQFEVHARRFNTLLNSTVHAVIDIMTTDGKIISSNTDSHGAEPVLVFTPNKDDNYVLRVRDLNSKGSPTSVYFVSAEFAQQDFRVKCDGDKAMIGPGSSTAWFVQVERTNGFAGPITVEVDGLPKGVTVNPLTIPASMKEGLLVLTAAKDAQLSFASVKVTGTAKLKDLSGKEIQATRTAEPIQEIYSPGGGRAILPVNMQTVVVTEPSDIRLVKVSQKRISLKPGQEIKIEVEIERSPEYKKGITTDVQLRHLNRVYGSPLPTGVTLVSGKSKTLLGTTSKGHITLKAAANATPVEDVPIAVLAHVSVNFVVKMTYCSEPILITIEKK